MLHSSLVAGEEDVGGKDACTGNYLEVVGDSRVSLCSSSRFVLLEVGCGKPLDLGRLFDETTRNESVVKRKDLRCLSEFIAYEAEIVDQNGRVGLDSLYEF